MIASNTAAAAGWYKITLTYNEVLYAGQTLRLRLRATTDESDHTNFFVDDATFVVDCSPQGPGLTGGAREPLVTVESVAGPPSAPAEMERK